MLWLRLLGCLLLAPLLFLSKKPSLHAACSAGNSRYRGRSGCRWHDYWRVQLHNDQRRAAHRARAERDQPQRGTHSHPLVPPFTPHPSPSFLLHLLAPLVPSLLHTFSLTTQLSPCFIFLFLSSCDSLFPPLFSSVFSACRCPLSPCAARQRSCTRLLMKKMERAECSPFRVPSPR